MIKNLKKQTSKWNLCWFGTYSVCSPWALCFRVVTYELFTTPLPWALSPRENCCLSDTHTEVKFPKSAHIVIFRGFLRYILKMVVVYLKYSALLYRFFCSCVVSILSLASPILGIEWLKPWCLHNLVLSSSCGMCLIFYTKWSCWPGSFAVAQLVHNGGLKGRLTPRLWAPFLSSLSIGNFQDIKYRSSTISALAANVTFVSFIDLCVCCSL